MAAINRAQIAKNLWPGIAFHFGDEYKARPTQYTALFDTQKSNKAMEEMVQQYNFGLAPVKNPGASVAFDEAGNAWTVRVQHEAYALGFIVTREAVKDDQYFDLVPKYSRALKRSMRITKETRAAAYYSLAFSATQPGGDGVALCANNHPLRSGGTLSNLGTFGDLSEQSLEAALIAIQQWTDERGLQIAVTPRSLHIPPALQFVAERILASNQRVGTADNDTNAMRNMRMLPGGYEVNHYFTDPDAWFIRTDCPDSMIHWEREALDIEQGDGMDNQVMKALAYERYSFVHADWRGVFGQPGA